MKKHYQHPWFIYPMIGLIVSAAIVALLYIILDKIGVKETFDAPQRELFVEWLRGAVNPKNYFKLFYNVSLVMLPLGASLIGYVFYKKHHQ